tara:strand:+ start:1182 stop:1313 length:132 start_codon:yes stop_codon:yes gene_type:complete
MLWREGGSKNRQTDIIRGQLLPLAQNSAQRSQTRKHFNESRLE